MEVRNRTRASSRWGREVRNVFVRTGINEIYVSGRNGIRIPTLSRSLNSIRECVRLGLRIALVLNKRYE
jgi:hypothetical protein